MRCIEADSKNQQDNIEYMFDVAKCNKIFDELHKVVTSSFLTL
jgi:hypothetical protein